MKRLFRHYLSAHHISGQMIRYGVIASVGLAADFGTLIFVKQILGLYYLIGVVCGFIVGLIFTYILSNKYVFGKPKMGKRKAFLLFGIIGAVGLLSLSLIVWILTSKIGLNYLVSKVIGTVFVFTWNFFARKSLYQDNSKAEPSKLQETYTD